jgi:hypothetical protein
MVFLEVFEARRIPVDRDRLCREALTLQIVGVIMTTWQSTVWCED